MRQVTPRGKNKFLTSVHFFTNVLFIPNQREGSFVNLKTRKTIHVFDEYAYFSKGEEGSRVDPVDINQAFSRRRENRKPWFNSNQQRRKNKAQ